MVLNNYHTHTKYCDGKATSEEMVKKAIVLGFSDIGFTSHVPLKMDNVWSMELNDLSKYCEEICFLKEKYRKQINIYLGLEYDFIYDKSYIFEEIKNKYDINFGIGSIHLVKAGDGDNIWFIDGPSDNYKIGLDSFFDGDARKAVEAYYKQLRDMIKTQEFDIVGHLDKVKMNNKGNFFDIESAWYNDEVEETLCLIKDKNLIVEANTRGIYTKKYNGLYPGKEILKKCYHMGIPLVVSTDAHKPEDLNQNYFETVKLLKDIGYDSLMRFNGKEWYPVLINN